MCRLARRFGERHLDHPLDHLRRQRRFPAPAGRVASCNRPSTPSAMKRSCQRQIVGLPLPVRRRPIVPIPSAPPVQSEPATRASADCSPIQSRLRAARDLPDQAGLQHLSLHPTRPAYQRAWWNHSSAPIHQCVEPEGEARRAAPFGRIAFGPIARRPGAIRPRPQGVKCASNVPGSRARHTRRMDRRTGIATAQRPKP